MTHPYLRHLRPTLHIAHRGGALLAPENTLLAFERAVRLYRTDMLELDVHATADGELVVAHDETLDRCTDGAGPLAARTFAELRCLDAGFHCTSVTGERFRGAGARIPRLTEILDAFPGLRLNVELKAPGAFEPFVALMRRLGAFDRVCLGSADDALAERLVAALPDALHFYPERALAGFLLPILQGEAPPADPGPYAVLDMPLRWEGVTIFTAAVAAAARARGKWVNLWTVDEPDAMRAAIALGAGGLMTDRPDLLRAVLDAP